MNALLTTSDRRRYELDALRIMAVFAVLASHTAGLYTGATGPGWNQTTSPALSLLADISLNWRMPPLFFVAGAACVLALRNKSTAAYARERFEKLLIPLAFGMATYVPLYYAAVGAATSAFVRSGQIDAVPGESRSPYFWGWLWFIAYLALMTALALPIVVRANRNRWVSLVDRWAIRRSGLLLLCGGAIYIAGANVPYRLLLAWPWWDVLDLRAFLGYSALFGLGVAYGRLSGVRMALLRWRWASLAAYLALTAAALALRNAHGAIAYLELVVEAAATWAWVAGVVGAAQHYVTRRNPLIAQLADISYPAYLTHLPVVALVGWLVTPLHWPIAMEYPLALLLTAGVTYVLCQAIRTSYLTRVLFGMRKVTRRTVPQGVPAEASCRAA